MDQFLVDRCPLILRIFTSCSALCFGASAITNFIISFRYLGYTPAIVNLIGFFFSVVALVCEFSPFGLNVLMAAVPCLGEYRHRGILYFCVGFLTLGREMKWFGVVSGIFMILSGALNVLMHHVSSITPRSSSYGEVRSPGSAGGRFQRYENDESSQYDQLT
eukprot:GHVS01028068.1.p1 GENE.GHVS01028068.1~~GHVS01028068.1.p1  ORF type:complete len:162 (+),score=14.73 GHVS01028068.1:294-779(+)